MEDDSDPSSGGDKETMDDDAALDHEVDVIQGYDEDETGARIPNAEKTYRLNPVEGYVGIKINLNDKLYQDKAT